MDGDALSGAGDGLLLGWLHARRALNGGLGPGPGADGEWTAGLTQALVAVGALSAGDAARWRGRFREEVGLPQPSVPTYLGDERLRARARALLERLVARSEPVAYRAQFSVAGLLGAFELEEFREWMRRGAAAAGEPDPYEPRPYEPEPASALVRVLAGPGDRHDGVRLTSLEVYEHWVRVNGHVIAPAGPGPPLQGDRAARFGQLLLDRDPVERLGLSDDVGTTYRVRSGRPLREVWPQLGGPWSVSNEFVPAPPSAASRLCVHWRDYVWTIPIGETGG
jgi:hypothetical protein